MGMALPKQISILNIFILLITCNTDSTMQNSIFSSNHASFKRLVKPLSYDLTIDLSLNDFLVFHGASTNLIIIENPTRKIDLKVDGLRITISTLQLLRYPYMDKYAFQDYNYSNETETLSLDLDDDVPSGFYNMFIEFSGDIFENEIQIYTTSCEDCDGKARLIFTTQLERNGTRQIFPYWDGEASRARIGIAIQHYHKYTALSNMPIQEQSKINEFLTHTKFYSTPPIPVHLVAISLTDFVCLSAEKKGFTTRLCSTTLVENQTAFALEISAAVVSYMMWYMDISPRFTEITIIGIPDSYYQTAENWGFYIYRKDDLIYNASLHPIDRTLDVSMIVGSLTAFQWFNHLFSPMLWTHAWFHQTLALFYGAKAIAAEYIFRNDVSISSLFIYALQSLARENNIVRQIKPIWYDYNSEDLDKLNISKRHIFITSHFTNCLKEYALMVMLEYAVTERVFRMATISYLTKHQFSTATPNDFWDAIQDIIDKRRDFRDFPRIAHLMQNWLMQESLPVVTVKKTGQFYIIMRENMYKEKNNSNFDVEFIPINYIVKSSPQFVSNVLWLNKTSPIVVDRIVNTSPKAIVVNWLYTGYYRVKYDFTSSIMLATYLYSPNRKNINVLSRAHIIEDTYYFWTEKEFNTEKFKNLISFMFEEEKCAPWYAMQNIIKKMWTFLQTDVSKPIYNIILDILNRLLHKIGYTEHRNDTQCVKFKRLLATKWACRLFDKGCLDIANKELIKHLKNPREHIISPMWEEWTYCNGLMISDELIWNEVWTKFVETGNKKILIYLVCSNNDLVIRNYLDLIISKQPSVLDLFGLNFEDRRKIYRDIVQKHGGKDLILNYLVRKIAQMRPNNVSFVEEINYIIENVYSHDQTDMISMILLEIYENNVGIYDLQVYEDLLKKIKDQNSVINKLEQLIK